MKFFNVIGICQVGAHELDLLLQCNLLIFVCFSFVSVFCFVFLGEIPNEEEVTDGPVPWCKSNQLTFLAEQVSHHPPSEFFYFTFLSSYFWGGFWMHSLKSCQYSGFTFHFLEENYTL